MRSPRAVPSLALLAVGCGAPRAPIATPPVLLEPNDARFAAAVQLRGSTECSGVLVDASFVLTSAHCVAGLAALPRVYAGQSGDASGVERAVDRCAMHPRAYDTAINCLAPRSADDVLRVRPANDLAILHLTEPVPRDVAVPLAVAFDAPSPTFDHARVRVMSWLSTTLTGGEIARATGWNEVRGVADGVMATGPIVSTIEHIERFSTQPGDSGSPALFEANGHVAVVGVLSGGSSAWAVDSLFTTTFAMENAAWIRRELSGG